MSALGFLAASSMLAGGLPPLWGRRKAPRMPDPVAQDRAAAKRARKAAKRAEDARRTAEGRGASSYRMGWAPPRGIWDQVCWFARGHLSGPRRDAVVTFAEPKWRQRLNHRRSLPWPPLWWCRW